MLWDKWFQSQKQGMLYLCSVNYIGTRVTDAERINERARLSEKLVSMLEAAGFMGLRARRHSSPMQPRLSSCAQQYYTCQLQKAHSRLRIWLRAWRKIVKAVRGIVVADRRDLSMISVGRFVPSAASNAWMAKRRH